jgi:hypothetical protein
MIHKRQKASIVLILIGASAVGCSNADKGENDTKISAMASSESSGATVLSTTPFVMSGWLNDRAKMQDDVLNLHFQPDGWFWRTSHYYPRTGKLRHYSNNGELMLEQPGPAGDWSSAYCASLTTYVLMPLQRNVSAAAFKAEPDPQIALNFVRSLGQLRDSNCLNKPINTANFANQCASSGPGNPSIKLDYDGKTFSYHKKLDPISNDMGYCRTTTIDVATREVKTISCDPSQPEELTGCSAVSRLIEDMRSYGCTLKFNEEHPFREFRRWMLMNLAESCQQVPARKLLEMRMEDLERSVIW